MSARIRLTNAQQIRLIEWIKAGKSEVEVNELALHETPPFVVSHRKYMRYRAAYSPERAREVMALIERVRAQVQASRQFEEPLAPPEDTQPPKAPTPTALTITDWVREMLVEEERERKKSARAKGWDAFRI